MVAVKLRFLRAFGRVGGGERVGDGFVGKGGKEEELDALRNKFKRTSVEFEPRSNTRCNTGHVSR